MLGGSDQQKYGVLSLQEFEKLCAAEPCEYVVEMLIPESSVCIAVGDSGLGKSPWAYQLGLCVVSGRPFLGHPVKQGRVLYIDLENGRDGIRELTRALAKHLGIAKAPDNFLLLTEHDNLHVLGSIVAEYRPVLVIVDSLRAFRPDAEAKNENAASLLNELHAIAEKYKAAFLLIHHIKKPGDNGVPALEDVPVMTWLQQACGARALVNQSDVRIAFDKPAGMQRFVSESNKAKSGKSLSEVGLVVKGYVRLRGEFGPLYLARDFDEDGNPLGYRPMAGLELLYNSEQQSAFQRLPDTFRFKEAKSLYERGDQATSDFLQKCIRVGILRKPAKGLYEKIESSGVSGANS